MKIILSCLNSKYIHMSSAPWCLAAGIRTFYQGEAVYEVMESTINGDLAAFGAEIAASRPAVVAFSCYIWNVESTLSLAKAVKKQTGCTVVLGGPEVAYRPQQILREHPFVDYVLAGEGEFCFPQLLEYLEGSRPVVKVDGLTYRKDGEVRSNPEGVYLQTPPSPFHEEYFNALQGRICYVESSRGCPYRCAFCLSGRGSPLRFFDLEGVKKDLLRLAQSGTQTIKFVDRTFNAKEDHANEIFSFILSHYGNEIPQGVCFHFEIAGDILRESTLALLEQMPTGAVQLEIGMQSFNESTLAAIHRRTDIPKLIRNIRRLVAMQNMHIHIDLIAGLTGEGLESFAQSFNTGYALGAHMLQMGFLKLLHGAEMREDPRSFPCEFSSKPPYEVTATPWLSAREVQRLKKCEDALERLYNSGRFVDTLEYLLSSTGLTPFELFYTFGNEVDGGGMTLGAYALEVFRFFQGSCNPLLLRECLVSDLLSCASALQIPKELKITDPRHKKAMALYAQSPKTKVVILENSEKLLVVDQQGKRDLWGRYPRRFYSLDLFKKCLDK